VLLAALIGGLFLLLARRRHQNLLIWQRQTRSAVEAAHLAQGLLPASGQDIVNADHWESVRHQVEQAAQSLDLAADKAPNQETAGTTHSAAQALRDVAFALDSAWLMSDASSAPSQAEVDDAEVTTRTRRVDLDRALEQLDAIVPEPTTPKPGPGPTQTRHA